MSTSVAVGIVAYVTCSLHEFFLKETIESVLSAYSNSVILIYPNRVDLRLGNFEKFYLQRVEKEVSVAKAWNTLIEEGLRKADYVLILNSDVILRQDSISNLLKFAEEHKEAIMWTMAEAPDRRKLESQELSVNFDEHPHFSAFMVDKRLFEKVGKFDENFEMAYMEDLDMHLRILLAGEKALKTASALFYHYGSRTIACDLEVKARSDYYHARNRDYFKRKWGVDGWQKSANEIYKLLKEKNL